MTQTKDRAMVVDQIGRKGLFSLFYTHAHAHARTQAQCKTPSFLAFRPFMGVSECCDRLSRGGER